MWVGGEKARVVVWLVVKVAGKVCGGWWRMMAGGGDVGGARDVND